MSVGLLASATSEQAMLVDTSVRFIEDTVPLSTVRALAESSSGADPAYFETAGSLGWFGMLVDEDRGGGSASGSGLLDAAAVGAERGAFLQPGPFVGMNVVAYLLSVAGQHDELLARLVSGQVRATWVAGAVKGLTPGAGEVVARPDGDGFVLTGLVRHVQDAVDCEVLLVTAHGPSGLTQVLVAVDAPGVAIRRMEGLDITRRTCAVRVRDVRVGAEALVGTPGVSTEDLFARQVRIAAVLAAAESVGAMNRDFELAVEYARTRVAFGRPIGSFQAVKHLLADTSLSLEMAKAVVAGAAEASSSSDGAGLAHAAKAFVAEHGIELTHACFQVFGGIGYTWEHDHHLYMRRLASDAVAFGSAEWHRSRLGERIGVA
jgi:alkylation response protein AidB-like acyl-CoA dehydrogenase